MGREEILERLRAHEGDIRTLGAKSLYLFGSVLRGEDRPDSDIDLFIDYDEASGFSLIELARMQAGIGSLLGRPVDLMTRNSIHPLIRNEVVATAERVF